MLIIPLSGKISKRNPPILTIGIVLINAFVYFVLQAGDDEKHKQAMQYYFESGLAEIEVSQYLVYTGVMESGKNDADSPEQRALNKRTVLRYYPRMRGDDTFIVKLRNDEIITPDEQGYSEWKDLRKEYEDLLSRVVYIHYGLTPAFINPVSIFTHMFLHGGFMHLLGNMVFLWLVGCVLELGCGRKIYLTMYLVTGVCSVALFSLVYMNSTVPLIGASGAISGLIGAYTVLYGKRKIKVFYSLGFYFNYAKIPSIFLLPVWIGNELFQLFFGSYSNVAYVAHIGGIVSGAALGYLVLKFFGLADEEVFDEDPKEKIPGLLEEALRLMAKLDMDDARAIAEEILAIDPNNREALLTLFNIDKLAPQSDQFHKTVSRLFTHLSNDTTGYELLYELYKEYCRISKPPKFNPDLFCTIASIFSERGHLQEAEQIMAFLLRNNPKNVKIPPRILKLGRAYLKKGMSDKGEKCLRVILKRFPGSNESQIAKGLLRSLKSTTQP